LSEELWPERDIPQPNVPTSHVSPSLANAGP